MTSFAISSASFAPSVATAWPVFWSALLSDPAGIAECLAAVLTAGYLLRISFAFSLQSGSLQNGSLQNSSNWRAIDLSVGGRAAGTRLYLGQRYPGQRYQVQRPGRLRGAWRNNLSQDGQLLQNGNREEMPFLPLPKRSLRFQNGVWWR